MADLATPRSTLDFAPDQLELGRTELLPIALDFSPYLLDGESITQVVVTVTTTRSGVDKSAMVSGTPSVAGALAQVWLDGSQGTPGEVYRLEATITKSSGARMAAKLTVIGSY